MQFLRIDRHIEQVVRTSSFFAKVKGQDKNIISILEEQYNKDKSDLDSAVAICFYQWFLADDKLDLADTNSIFQVTFDVINKLEDTLEKSPEYWILWILKYKIISFMNFNENELIRDLQNLIEEQQKNEMMSYYLVTNVLLAHICYTKDKREYATQILENIFNQYKEKIHILSNFFKGYVIEFKNVVMRSGDDYILNLLERILITYF